MRAGGCQSIYYLLLGLCVLGTKGQQLRSLQFNYAQSLRSHGGPDETKAALFWCFQCPAWPPHTRWAELRSAGWEGVGIAQRSIYRASSVVRCCARRRSRGVMFLCCMLHVVCLLPVALSKAAHRCLGS